MSFTVLGFDVGHKKIGVAAGQSLTGSAQGIDVVRMQHGQPDWDTITRLVNEWQPDRFVVGMPKTADGKQTALMKLIKRFAATLAKRYQREVAFIDETLTSVEADFRVRSGAAGSDTRGRKTVGKKRLDKRDSVAAELIVETWFNSTL